MKLTKTRPQATTGEPLVTFWQGGQGGDLDAVQVYEDGLLIHTNTQQKKRRYKKEFVPFASFEGTKIFFGTLHLVTKGQRGVRTVGSSDERTARELQALASAGIRAAAHSEGGDEASRIAALEDLRERAKEARRIFGEATEVSVRELSVPSYDPDLPERRAAIVGRLPVGDGSPAQARQDAHFVLSELRRHYASAAAYRRTRGGRPGFKAYFNLAAPAQPGEGGVAGGYAELGYRPEDDTFLLRLHNGLEDELSATTEDHVAELVGEAAPTTVFLESFSREV
jgi:hypothetical protein